MFAPPAKSTPASSSAPPAGRTAGRWTVEVDGASPGWADGLDGVRVLGDGSFEAADEQLLLDAARRAGRVRRFGPVQASLSELFREAVA